MLHVVDLCDVCYPLYHRAVAVYFIDKVCKILPSHLPPFLLPPSPPLPHLPSLTSPPSPLLLTSPPSPPLTSSSPSLTSPPSLLLPHLLPPQLALRAGNEKDADESADTVGCCSLRVEHISEHPTVLVPPSLQFPFSSALFMYFS